MSLLIDTSFLWNTTVWNPSMISTALWLDAADATTVVSSGGRISQWSDKSGNGRNATQATGAQHPKVTAAAQNSRNVVEFDPASNSFQRLSFSRLTGLGHVFFVAKKNNVNDSDIILIDGSADDLRGVVFGSGAGSDFIVQQITGSLSTATRNAWHIAEIKTDGTNASLGIDGTRTTNVDSDVMNLSEIGYYRNFVSAFVPQYSFRGQIGEIVMSASALNDATRQKIEGYLAHKWGLGANLPNDHPYKTVGPKP